MLINLNLDTTNADDLRALKALVDALGGRTAPPVFVGQEDRPAVEPVETPEPPVVEGMLDADGLPWDDRIHSTPAKMTAAGVWRKKRGVDEVTFGKIAGELAEAVGNSGPAQVAAPPPPAMPTEGNADTAAPAAPTVPPPPAPVVDAPAANGSRFPEFKDFVHAVSTIRSPSIPYLELNGYAQSLGVDGGFKDMKDHPALWETFFSMAGGQ
jgi:hypothetical protein